MRSDEQVRHDANTRSSFLATDLSPELPRLRGGVIENRIKADAEIFHRFGKLRVGLKMGADFGPDDLARHDSTAVVREPQRLARALPVNRISAEKVQKDR